MHHGLVAGSTGSGKSNTIANLIKCSQNLGACTFVLDHKPDYQDMEKPNDEGLQPYFRGMDNVSYWSLGSSNRPEETPIHVLASDLDPAILSTSILYNRTENLAAETLEMLLAKFNDLRKDQEKEDWTWGDFMKSIPKNSADAEALLEDMIHKGTYGSMLRKIKKSSRVPEWIQGTPYGGGRFQTSSFDLSKMIAPGRIIVIRISSDAGGGRGYGLFLSYLLRTIYELKASKKVTVPIATVIDEAQDIFNAGPSFAIAIGGMLSENIRKGRSMKIGYMIGVQSADAIPAEIQNNLNSQFIHKHANSSQATEAMSRASKEQLSMTNSFGTGECLAYMFGSNAVIHCKMLQSPFMLTKND